MKEGAESAEHVDDEKKQADEGDDDEGGDGAGAVEETVDEKAGDGELGEGDERHGRYRWGGHHHRGVFVEGFGEEHCVGRRRVVRQSVAESVAEAGGSRWGKQITSTEDCRNAQKVM